MRHDVVVDIERVVMEIVDEAVRVCAPELLRRRMKQPRLVGHCMCVGVAWVLRVCACVCVCWGWESKRGASERRPGEWGMGNVACTRASARASRESVQGE